MSRSPHSIGDWKKQARRPGPLKSTLDHLDEIADLAQVEGDAMSAYRLKLAKSLILLVLGVREEDTR